MTCPVAYPTVEPVERLDVPPLMCDPDSEELFAEVDDILCEALAGYRPPRPGGVGVALRCEQPNPVLVFPMRAR